MTTISGYVRVKETNEPIADLIVSALARDPTEVTIKAKTDVQDPFKFYSLSIGSTITNERGGFQIEFDPQNAVSVTSKAQRKTELLIAVLAPATTETANRVAALSPSKRLLYWIEVSLLAESKSESLVILLLEEQLQQFGIKLPGELPKKDIQKSVARRVEAERESLLFQKTLREGLAPIRTEFVSHRREVIQASKRFVASLYATPKSARDQRKWVPHGGNIELATHHAMETGLNDIAKAAKRSPFRLNVWLTDDQMERSGFEFGDIEAAPTVPPIVEDVSREQLCALMNLVRGGTELIYVQGLLNKYKAEADAQERTQGGVSGGEETPEGEVPAEGAVEAALVINRRILGQLRDMPVNGMAGASDRSRSLTSEELNAMLPATKHTTPGPQTAEELNAKLPGVSLPAGPSDVPAFHDFYNLQIAFPHVWMEAFDENLRSQITDYVRNIFYLHEDWGIEFKGMKELEEISDLNEFIQEFTDSNDSMQDPIPADVEEEFDFIKEEGWNQLSEVAREQLIRLARYKRAGGNIYLISRSAHEIYSSPSSRRTRLMRLLKGISDRLSEPYAFHYFAPKHVNFGLLLTYRQLWQPGPYQVGDLVSTIPLAPGEKRKYTTKQVIKRTRAVTELEKSLSSKSRELTTTQRVEAEITKKASLRTNFQMTAEGSLNLGPLEIKAGSRFETDQSQESSRVKRDFREAVLKAAQEYKQERSLQVQTTDELTAETTTSGELSNPNNELTVTYLLYELERQFTISERLHRATPVVLVPQDVPAPHEITESWLLAHDWILRRVLLDDALNPALDYLSDAFAGEELSVSVHKASWEKQIDLVTQLEGTVKGLKSTRDELREMLVMTEETRALSEASEPSIGERIGLAIVTGGASELEPGGVSAEEHTKRLEIARRATESRLEYLEETLREAQERFISAEEALNEATRAYTQALETQTNRRVAIDQLRIHIKENILYYMQAIWDHEPPDQRFFRLYHIDVNLPESETRTCTIRRATAEEEASGIPLIRRAGHLYIIESCSPPSLPDPSSPNTKPLVEIADLDRPLGYKGNYIIFPLKTCLYLTDFMMREFFDDYFGIRDPDLAANFTVEELLQYTERLLSDERLNPAQHAALQTIVMTKLRQPRRDSDLVVVPTGELYMEALLGEHALLEEFKLNHRFFDMAKARAEWREAELENLRRAARLLQEEPNLEDPDVDKRIVVEGASNTHIGLPE